MAPKKVESRKEFPPLKEAAPRKGKRQGGRGCPECGSHDTDNLRVSGAQWCNTCGHRWVPCDTPYCKGFEIDLTGDVPVIRGCRGCGVPDRIARWWPEAWRAVYVRLGERGGRDRLEAVTD